MLASKKTAGPYEEPLIRSISQFFRRKGFSTYPHARLNVSWGAIISDIDVVAINHGTVVAVEVKSRRDKILKAVTQLEKVSDYADFVYLATDRLPRSWTHHKIGVLLIERESVVAVKPARALRSPPRLEAILALPRACLVNSLGLEKSKMPKYRAAELISTLRKERGFRRWIKDVVLCDGQCESHSPIWKYLER